MSATLSAVTYTDRVQTSLEYEVLVPLIQETFTDYQSNSWITARAMVKALPPTPEIDDDYRFSYVEFRESVVALAEENPYTQMTLDFDAEVVDVV
jgi:hypothetical protein